MTIQWTEKGRVELEARIYCPVCNIANVVTAIDKPHFFENEASLPYRKIFCDKCGKAMKIIKAKKGVTLL